MTQLGRHVAIVKFQTQLKGINGTGGYWHNLGGRVYNRLVVPEDNLAKMPYLCLPLIDDAPTDEEENRYMKVRWRQPIFGFVKETLSNPLESAALIPLLQLQDDVRRAVGSDWSLGKSVKDSRFIGGGYSLCGVEPNEPYAEFMMILEMDSFFSIDNIGSVA